jgi:putative peptidoglycan lipid II flippase
MKVHQNVMDARNNTKHNDDNPQASPYSRSFKERIEDLSHKTFLLIIIAVIIKIFGLIRMSLTASIFGATTDIDMFFAIFGSTIIFFEILPPAFNQALVPRYIDLLVQGKRDEFNRAVSTSMNWVLVISLIVVIISIEFGASIRETFFQFPAGTDQMFITWANWLFKLAMIYLFMNVFIGSFTAVLYAHDQVISPSILNFISGMGVLVCMVIFHGKMGIFSLVLGYLTGGICQIIYLWYFIRKTGFKWNPFSFVTKDGFKYYVGPIGPAYIAMLIAQLNIIIDRIFCSRMNEPGSVTLLQYASQLLLIILIFSQAFTNAILPKLSSSKAMQRTDEFKTLLVDGILIVLFLVLPLAITSMATARPICNLILYHGKFAENTDNLYITFKTFRILLVWSLLYLVNIQFFNVFYIYKDFRTPLIISSVNVFVNTVFKMIFTGITFNLNIPVVGQFGLGGVALSTTIGIAFSIILSLILLKPKIGNILDLYALKHLVKLGVASFVALVVSVLVNREIFVPLYKGVSLGITLPVLSIVCVGIVTFAVFWAVSLAINRSRTVFIAVMIKNFVLRKRL